MRMQRDVCVRLGAGYFTTSRNSTFPPASRLRHIESQLRFLNGHPELRTVWNRPEPSLYQGMPSTGRKEVTTGGGESNR
jgi:hypothetical protein